MPAVQIIYSFALARGKTIQSYDHYKLKPYIQNHEALKPVLTSPVLNEDNQEAMGSALVPLPSQSNKITQISLMGYARDDSKPNKEIPIAAWKVTNPTPNTPIIVRLVQEPMP